MTDIITMGSLFFLFLSLSRSKQQFANALLRKPVDAGSKQEVEII